jgi:hypothetical protein
MVQLVSLSFDAKVMKPVGFGKAETSPCFLSAVFSLGYLTRRVSGLLCRFSNISILNFRRLRVGMNMENSARISPAARAPTGT